MYYTVVNMVKCVLSSYFVLLIHAFFLEAVVKNADLMFKQSVWTSLIAASIASKHLKEYVLLAALLNN